MGATDDLGDLTARLKLDTSEASSAVKGVADGFPLIGAAAVAAAGAVAAIGVVSTDMAAKFQQSLTLVQTQAGDTTDNINQLGDALMNLAPQVGQTPEMLAQAFFHLASAGYTGAQGLDILRQSAELADIGQSNLEQTTDAVVGALKSGVPGIKSAADAVGVLNAIVGSGNMHMQDLVEAMGSGILAVAGTFKVSIQSVGAALSFMTDQGVPAADAATRLKMSMALMVAPTAQATKLLTDAGLSAKDAADETSAMQQALEKAHVTTNKLATDLQQPNGFVVALQDLKTNMDKAGVSATEQAATIARAFGGGKSGSALIDLYNNLDGVRQKFDDINKGASNFGKDWQQQSQTASQRAADFKAQLDALSIKFGNLILPAATEGLSKLTQLLSQDIAPAIQSKVVPAIQELVKWVEEHLVPAIEKVGTWLWNDFINPMVHIGEAVLPPVIAAVQLLLDHLDQLKVPLEAIAVTLAGMWAVNKIGEWWTAASAAVTKLLALIDGASAASVLPAVGAGGAATETVAGGALLAGPAAFVAAGITAPLVAWGIVLAQQISDNEASFELLNRRGDQAAKDMGLAGDDLKTLTSFLQRGGQTLEDSFSSFVSSAAFTSLNAQQQSALMSDLVDEIRNGKVNSVKSMLDFVTNWAAMAQSSAGAVPNAQAVEQQIASVKAQLPQLIKTMIDNFAAIGTQAGRAVNDTSQIADELGIASGDLANFGAQVSGLAGGITSALGYAQTHAQQLQQAMSGVQIPTTPTPGTSPWSAFGGHWSGGIIPPGQWGINNENGPEPVYADPSGAVVFPHGSVTPMGAGGVVLNVYVQGAAPSPDDIARAIGWEMAR